MAPSSIMSCLSLMVLLLTLQAFSTEAILSKFSKVGKFSPDSSDSHSKVFIVYLGGVTQTTHPDAHITMLSGVLGSAGAAQASIVYSYTNSFDGFAAVFSDSQADLLRGMDEVVSVFPSKTYQLQTSYSWEFLGLNQNQGLWPSAEFGNDTIIGMIDTGVWPESKSFNDDGFGPIPSTWKGECVKAEDFGPENCNKKLIGGKFFNKGFEAIFGPIVAPEYNSTRDDVGHGTHTASTAAGRQVSNASFDGVCNGTISGGAPAARVAAYKVCWLDGICTDSDILAGFDAAVKDGVNLISLSIGGFAFDYFSDSIAIGSYHAVENGILVSAAAGNSGPAAGNVANVAPWIFTVAASTMNRKFTSTLELGCHLDTVGTTTSALNTFTLNQSSYPLAYGPDIAISGGTIGDASFCRDGSIDKLKAKGKILLCQYDDYFNTTDENVLPSGAAGVVIISTAANEIVQFAAVLPATYVTQDQAEVVLNCITNAQSDNTSPTAYFGKSETVFQSAGPAAPATPYFSSPGPNLITQDILKPDIAAPGVDIIASWPPNVNPSESPGDPRHTNFNIISGTSMATPHVTGAAALIKSVHPDWSPAAVRSALMTTAIMFKDAVNQFNVSRELASGSGQIDPTKAADPGLIYDLKTSDYERFLCGIGYTTKQVQSISGKKNDSCPPVAPQAIDLNYPSIMLVGPLLRVGSFIATTKRIVTNVGPASGNATYTVSVVNPNGMNVAVTPTTLTFADLNAKKSFSVTITVDSSVEDFVFGSITWSDSNGHSVRIPVGFGPAS